MKNKYTIYIPSKDRPQHCLTAKLLEKNNINFYIVIEPQDLDKYIEVYPLKRLLLLPKNDQGIAYVRNWIKFFSIFNNEDFHWQIDDNIRAFSKRENDKNNKISPIDAFNFVENYIKDFVNIGIVGLKHQVFAWSCKEDISINKQVYSCVLVNNKLKIDWRDQCVEDTDYSLQVLTNNFCTIIFNRYVIDKVATQKMKGGNTEISYSGEGRNIRALGLQKNWPNIFKIKEQYGRVKVSPSRVWSKFPQIPLKDGEKNVRGLFNES
tara:strand:+ start:711 stop:1505 length:795 start_codon:yes stop_codon:yes gene_type:complete